MSDEIYDVMTYDGASHTSLLNFPEIRDRLIILNGWSKTWAMTGWRMGWSIWPTGPEGNYLYDKVRKLAVNCWSCVNTPSQFAELRPSTARRIRSMRCWWRSTTGANWWWKNSTPSRAFHAQPPRVPSMLFQISPSSASRPSHWPQGCWKKRVWHWVGGPDFGDFGEGYIRLSCAASEDRIEEAIRRIAEFVEEETDAGTIGT